eukprot:2573095-Rhodomonas_salina.1
MRHLLRASLPPLAPTPFPHTWQHVATQLETDWGLDLRRTDLEEGTGDLRVFEAWDAPPLPVAAA